MFKLKRFIPALLSVVFAFAIFASACKSEKNSIDKNALVGITLDTSKAKKSYELGEKFSAADLVVYATMKDIDSGLETQKEVSKKAKIDSSKYVATSVGTYEIFVSYTHAGVTRSDSYKVDVNKSEPQFGGITVEWSDSVVNTQNLSLTVKTITIPQDQLVVKKVDKDGNAGEILTSKDYNVELYLGSVKQSSWTVGGGAYTVLVSLKSNPNVNNFVNFYVVDKLNSMKWLDTADGTVTEIEQWSTDYAVRQMASTWKFEIGYISGAKKTVTIADPGLTYTCNVEVAGQKVINIAYSALNAIGETEKKDAAVTINVKALDADTHTYTYDFEVLKATLGSDPADKTPLTAACFTGVNSFLKFVEDGSSKDDQYRAPGTNCIEIKGGRLEVTFEGKGYIEIGFSSTGGSNISGIALKDYEGNYMYGSVQSGNAVGLLEDDDYDNKAGLFIVQGTGESIVKFSVEKAGTYTIYGMYTYSGGSRGSRIKTINMVDVVAK